MVLAAALVMNLQAKKRSEHWHQNEVEREITALGTVDCLVPGLFM